MATTSGASPHSGSTRRGRAATLLAWFGANAVLGYLLAFPLASGILLGRHLVARTWGTALSPYDGEDDMAQVSAFILIVIGGPLLTAATVISLMVRRRLALRGWRVVVFWLGAAMLLLGPLAIFYFGELTVSEMLGKGLLW